MTPDFGSVSDRPYWWQDKDLTTARDTGDLPAKADVAVIGGGLTGLSAARTLAMNGASVVVLEQHTIGFGASTRNGGMIGNGHRLGLLDAQRQYGPEIGQGLIAEADAAYDFAAALIADEAIECDFERHGRLVTAWTGKDYDRLSRTVEALRAAGIDDVEVVSKAAMAQEIDTGLYQGGCLYRRHGGFHPFKYLMGLKAAAQRHGAQLCPETAVRRVAWLRDGYRLDTTRGDLTAAKIIAATNGYTPRFLGRLARRIIPVPSFIIATEDIGENRARALLPGGRMMVETRSKHGYYRLSPDGKRLLVGGRAALMQIPQDEATARMRRLMLEIFPSLEDVALTHSWRGTLGFTFSALPSVGAEDGIHHALGFNGSGNAMAPWLGHKAALQTLDDPDGDTVFSRTPFPARFYHRGTPWFLPLADAQFRVKDWWDGRRA